MKDKLNIIKKDFEDFLLIKKYNQKFNLNIKDVDIELFDIHEKNFGNEILEYFYEVEFYKLKEINLNENKISDISALAKAKLEKLETLFLKRMKYLILTY